MGAHRPVKLGAQPMGPKTASIYFDSRLLCIDCRVYMAVQVCANFNVPNLNARTKSFCTRTDCGRLHICDRCESPSHPVFMCPEIEQVSVLVGIFFLWVAFSCQWFVRLPRTQNSISREDCGAASGVRTCMMMVSAVQRNSASLFAHCKHGAPCKSGSAVG
jgi:hypothetical protein